MGKVMTWAEIEEAFDGEWVLIEDPETTPVLEILRGKVVFHGKNKDELYRTMRELSPVHSAIIYIGDPPEDLEYLLSSQTEVSV